MSLQRLLAWIRTKRRGSTQSQDDLGVVISARLKELLQVKNPEPVETTSTESPNEDDQDQRGPRANENRAGFLTHRTGSNLTTFRALV